VTADKNRSERERKEIVRLIKRLMKLLLDRSENNGKRASAAG
jgi:hypothetical protein